MADTNIEAKRQAFEAWYRDEAGKHERQMTIDYHLRTWNGDGYDHTPLDITWKAAHRFTYNIAAGAIGNNHDEATFMANLYTLAKLAQSATPGPWTMTENWDQTDGAAITAAGVVIADDGSVFGEYSQKLNGTNAAYMAAANPAVILPLIARVRRATLIPVPPASEFDQTVEEWALQNMSMTDLQHEVRRLRAALISHSVAPAQPPSGADKLEDLWIHEDMARDALASALKARRKDLEASHSQAVEDLLYWKRRALTGEAKTT